MTHTQAAQRYPLVIDGYAEDKATGETVQLFARRTGEVDDGCEVYQVQTENGGDIPFPGLWFQAGRIAIGFDLIPGLSRFSFVFDGGAR